MKGMRIKRRRQLLGTCIGVVCSLVVLIPIFLMIVNSFKDLKSANLLKLNFSGVSINQIVENYMSVIEKANLLSSVLNSLIVTVFSVIFVVLFSSMAAFVVVRRKTKAMRITNNLIIMGLTLPGAMVPTYFMLSKMKMTNGSMATVGAVFVYIAVNFSLAFFLYTGFFKGISSELDEAAIIDGVSPLGLFFRIIFPVLKPVTATVAINVFLMVWNDFVISLYLLNSSERSTAVLSTYLFLGRQTSKWNLLFADVVLVSLPVVILYFLLQKYIVAGLTAGALKG